MVVSIERIFQKDRRMCREVKWHGSSYRASGKKENVEVLIHSPQDIDSFVTSKAVLPFPQ